ncbi:MAG: MFS transporter [Mycobacteriales bacterium]
MSLLERALASRRVGDPRRTFALVWSARVAMSSGRALAAVVVPLYLAQIGFSGLRLGLLFLTVGLASALLSSATGLLSDRLGRRVFMVGFPLLTAGAAITYAFSTRIPVLFVAAALGSFGRGAGAGAGMVGPYQPVESALVSEVTPAVHRNRAFGRLAFGSSLGALVGGLLATSASARHGHQPPASAMLNYRPVFLLAAGVCLLAGILALWLAEPARAPRQPRRAGLHLPQGSRALLIRLWVTNSVNGLGVGMFGPFLTYWFYVRFGAGPAQIGILYAAVNAISLVSTLAAAPLARRWGLIRITVAVRLAQGALLVPMVLAGSFLFAGAIYLVRMAVQRIGMPLRQSYVLAMADPEELASVAALANMPSQLLMSASPVVSGYLLDQVSLTLPFELAGILQMINGALYWAFFRHRPPAEESAAQMTG